MASPSGSGPKRGVRIGLISDTHGVLDPRVVAAFTAEAPLAAIVHAGDIGSMPDVLWSLEALAPVAAVLGNCDHTVPGWELTGLARMSVAGVRILVIHDIADLGPIPEDVDVVVRGHSHAPAIEWRGDVLVVNPGSASQRRRQPSRSVAVLDLVEGERPAARIVALDEIEPAK